MIMNMLKCHLIFSMSHHVKLTELDNFKGVSLQQQLTWYETHVL